MSPMATAAAPAPAARGEMRRPHVLVVGAGGVGGYFGARLARAGERVTFLARGAHLEAIRRHGLRVRSAVEGEYAVSAAAVEDPRGLPPADLVLLCVKAYDTEAALERVRPVVGPGTAVLPLQNGVDAADRVTAVLGPGHALGGVAYVFAVIEAPGVIAHRFAGHIVFGELDGRLTPRVEEIRAAFDRAGIRAEPTAEVERALWDKYVMICAQAGMTALTRATLGVVRDTPPTWAMYRALVAELVALAGAAGVTLGPDAAARTLDIARRLPAEASSSLANDLHAGRRLELEALHGHAGRLAERLGLDTPMLRAVYAALAPHAGGRGG